MRYQQFDRQSLRRIREAVVTTEREPWRETEQTGGGATTGQPLVPWIAVQNGAGEALEPGAIVEVSSELVGRDGTRAWRFAATYFSVGTFWRWPLAVVLDWIEVGQFGRATLSGPAWALYDEELGADPAIHLTLGPQPLEPRLSAGWPGFRTLGAVDLERDPPRVLVYPEPVTWLEGKTLEAIAQGETGQVQLWTRVAGDDQPVVIEGVPLAVEALNRFPDAASGTRVLLRRIGDEWYCSPAECST